MAELAFAGLFVDTVWAELTFIADAGLFIEIALEVFLFSTLRVPAADEGWDLELLFISTIPCQLHTMLRTTICQKDKARF